MNLLLNSPKKAFALEINGALCSGFTGALSPEYSVIESCHPTFCQTYVSGSFILLSYVDFIQSLYSPRVCVNVTFDKHKAMIRCVLYPIFYCRLSLRI